MVVAIKLPMMLSIFLVRMVLPQSRFTWIVMTTVKTLLSRIYYYLMGVSV